MDLAGMFYPESVAVIGASNKRGKVGNAIVRSLKRKYSGEVFPVNIDEEEILGIEAYHTIEEVPDPVDLAIIALPAKIVPDIVEECGSAGVKNLIIVSAGFSEAGRRDLELEIKRTVDEHDMNLIGPNCLGIYNPSVELDSIFNPPERQDRPRSGSIAFLSQSGAFGAAVLDWFSEADIGLSKFVSYGNRVDVDEADLIDYLSEDEETEFIIFYIEGVKNGREFFEAAERCSKPIMAVKSGRTEEGSSAATSHTASLAGKDKVYDGAFKQSDIIRAHSLREMFNVAKAFSSQPVPTGCNVAVVTNGGGAGVMAADELVERGLKLSRFSEKTKEKFDKAVENKIIPEHATLGNPVDLVGDATPKRYEVALDMILQDDEVDAVIVVFLLQSPSIEEDIVDRLDGLQGDKPIIAVAPGGRYTHEFTAKIEEKGVPVYQTPRDAVQAIWGLCRCCPDTD
ncbi:MAG: acetate--CoA ligase family protein [Candidatus Natronoplasma sp.]